MRDVREDSAHVRRVAFLLWLFAFLVCLAFFAFIVRHYIDDLITGFPKLP
jgi:hypothetical protein